MDRHYAMELLRDAMREPRRLIRRKKFWHPLLFECFLERCNELSYEAPHEGLALARFGPDLAARVAVEHPECSAPVLLLQAYTYLGSAFRRVSDLDSAAASFKEALKYEAYAPAPVVAELYLRIAYLRLFQEDLEVFQLVNDAIEIHRRGDYLIDRHDLGRCFLCRGIAFHTFEHPGKSLKDLSAALNHLSLAKGPRAYNAALYNLNKWIVDYGSDQELESVKANLKPSMSSLHCYNGRDYTKLIHRRLIGLVDVRLGHDGAAELTLRKVQEGFEKLKLPYEMGMVAVDRAVLYRKQGRFADLELLAEETASIFRRIGIEPAAQEALDVWRKANVEELRSEGFLEQLRGLFAQHTEAMPSMA